MVKRIENTDTGGAVEASSNHFYRYNKITYSLGVLY